jgi:putative transposase
MKKGIEKFWISSWEDKKAPTDGGRFSSSSTKEASRKCFWASSMAFRGWRKSLRRCIRKPMCSVVSCTKSATPSAVFGKKISFEDLKLIYRAPNKEMALQMFQQFESKWSSKYPREVQSWANELDVLLTCMDDPSSIRSVIYTTNAIERTIKEIRKRLKPMNSLSSLEAAEKVVYLTIQDFNEKWAGRKLRGFAEAHEALERMFEERYH